MRKTTSLLVAIAFILSCIMPPQGFAQAVSAMGLMPPPGTSAGLTAGFTPAHLTGMTIHSSDPFRFDFLIHRGDAPLTDDLKQEEYTRLIKYFLAALAVPDTEQWVNLSPYEQDRIIPDSFGRTEMGRDLLAQDYLLKQLSSSLTSPDTDLGKKFWDGVYAQVQARFGRTDMIADTFNKVWIVPNRAVVFEKGNSVYVLENHLKAMTEKDYLAMKNNASTDDQSDAAAVADISSQVMKEIILPAIEKEANEGKSFAPLRQVFSGMLLATWYKKALKDSILGKLYADQGKVQGVDQDPRTNEEIYAKYVQAFKQGVYNLIREDVDAHSGEAVPRKYFSGGSFNPYSTVDNTMLTEKDGDKAEEVLKWERKNVDHVAVKAVVARDVVLLDGTIASSFAVDRLHNYVKGLPKKYTPRQVKGALNRVAKAIAWENRGSWRDPFWSLLGARNVIIDAGLGVSVGPGVGMLRIFKGSEELLKVAIDNLDKLKKADDGSWILPELVKAVDEAMLVEKIKSKLLDFDWTSWNESGVLTLTHGQAVGMGILGLRLFELKLALLKGAAKSWPATPEERILMQYVNEEKNDRDHIVAEINVIRDMVQFMKDPNGLISNDRSYYRMIEERIRQVFAYENDFYAQVKERMFQPDGLSDEELLNRSIQLARANLSKIDFIKSDELPFFEFMVSDRLNKLSAENFDLAQRQPELSRDNAAYGGIDFAQSNLDMQIKRDGNGIVLPVSQQDLDGIRIDGLVPVILNIQPAVNVPLFT